MNSHLLSELEMVCDEVAILSKGEVKLQGNLKELTGKQIEFRISYEGVLPGSVREAVLKQDCRHEGGIVLVPVFKADEAMPVLDLLRGAGVVISGMERRSMSLEELFLDAVGTDQPGAMPPLPKAKVYS